MLGKKEKKSNRSMQLRDLAVMPVLQMLEKRVLFSFTPGNVVINQTGTGTTTLALTSASTAVVLAEYSTSVTTATAPVATYALPTTTGTGELTQTGSSTTEGQLTLSANNQYLVVPGYVAAPGVAAISSTTASADPREIDEIGTSGSVVTAVTSTTAFSGGNIRGAASDGTGDFWASGSNTGIVYFGTNSAAATVSSAATNGAAGTNTRGIQISNGQLYFSTGSATVGVWKVGTGEPTTAGTSVSQDILLDASGSPYGFAVSPDGNTIYVADSNALSTTGGIQKWTLVSGVYTKQYVLGGGFTNPNTNATEVSGELGLTVDWNTPTPTIYATTSDASGSQVLIKVVDNGSATASVYTVLASQAGNVNEGWRGVAFAPFTATTATTTAITSVTPTTTSTPASITFTATVTPASGATAPAGSVTFKNGSTVLATVATSTASGSVATFSTTATVPAGTYSNITATFAPSEGFAASTSAAYGTPLTITQSTIVVGITDNGPNPSAQGASVGFSVTVSGSHTVPNGTNVYLENTAETVTYGTATLTSGAATITSATLPAGTDNVIAVYPGDANGNPAGSSTSVAQTVIAAPVITGVTDASVTQPAIVYDGGGSVITIAGTNLSSATGVYFGTTGIAATTFSFNASGGISAVVPSSPTDLTGVTVLVVTPGGTGTYANAITFANNILAANTLATADAFTLTNPVTVTHFLSQPGTVNGVSYSNYAFLITDSSGASEDVYGTLPNSYVPAIGDTFNLAGTFQPFDGIPEITATSITNVAHGTSAPAAPITTFANASLVPQPGSIAGQLIELDNVYINNEGTATFTTSNTAGSATLSTGANGTGSTMSFYYYPTSYSVANNFFDGLAVPSASTPVNLIGIVDVFGSSPEFVPISEFGTPDKVSLATTTQTVSTVAGNVTYTYLQDGSVSSSDQLPDSYTKISRGSSLAITVNRTESNDDASVAYSITSDSGTPYGASVTAALAPAGKDYGDPVASTVATGGSPTTTYANGVYTTTGILEIPSGSLSGTITIPTASNPLDSGDKLFTFALTSVGTDATTSTPGYPILPVVKAVPAVIDIADPKAVATATINGTGQNAYVLAGGPKMTTTSSVASLTTTVIQMEGTSAGTNASFALMTFDDPNYTTSPLDPNGDTLKSIDGLELELAPVTESYNVSGPLNVYLLSNAIGGTGNGYGVTGDKFVSTGATNGVGGTLNTTTGVITNSTLGNTASGATSYTLLPLGTIQYSTAAVPGGYTPYNLTGINTTAALALASDLAATQNSGGAFTLVVTPGNSAVEAAFVGSNSTGTLQQPIVRVDYSTSLPSWITSASGPNTLWIAPSETLYVDGNTTIGADPAVSGDLPIIDDTFASTTVTVLLPTNTSGPSGTDAGADVHIGGVILTNGAEMYVPQIDAPSSTDISNGAYSGDYHTSDHNVLVIGSMSANVAPTVSIDSSSKLDLADNDLLIHTGTSASAGEAAFLNAQALGTEGRNAPDTTSNDGPWTGNGLTSSIAAETYTNDGSEITSLAVTLNSDLAAVGVPSTSFVGFTSWPVGTTNEPVGPNDVIIKYTYFGDQDLEGYIGQDDVNAVQGSFTGNTLLTAPANGYPNDDWAFGDFTGSGEDNQNDVNGTQGAFGYGEPGAGSGLPQL